MNVNKSFEDGQYSCSATLHIKDGKAVAVLYTMFGLAAGTELPLKRRERNLLVESSGTSEPGILNGTGII